MNERTWVDNLSRPCPVPVGTVIQLVAMPDDPDPIPPGTQGVVTGGNGAQMYVDWKIDPPRSLMVSVGTDRWFKVSDDG